MALDIQNVSFAAFLSVDFGDSYGSGFRLTHKEVDYIITARHVVYNQDKLLSDLYITSQNHYGSIDDAYSANVSLSNDNVFTFGTSDIALIRLDAKSNYHVANAGNDIFSVEIETLIRFNDIRLARNIITVGFPSSLTVDRFYDVDRPLLRTGIVAGINQSNLTFVIDSLAFYGVSGGPIIQINDDKTININGIISRYVPFITEWKNKHERAFSRQDFYNSGYAVCEPLDNIINKVLE